MMERGRRLVLLLLATSLLLPLFWKGHGESRREDPVAFVRYSAAGITVRLKGAVPAPGVYRFSDGVTVGTVINVTAPPVWSKVIDKRWSNTRLSNGDILEVVVKDRQHVDITVGKMKAKERMLLGIPLHPDAMDGEDWESLPGIGPRLAQAITHDRQNNGDFGSLEALRRVPGIGETKLKGIAKFF